MFFVDAAAADSCEFDSSGDCFGVLNAPVDCCWSFSKISCSSLGRRGGAGPGDQEELDLGVVEKGRRWWRDRALMRRIVRVVGSILD